MAMVTISLALGRMVSGDQGTSDSVCWPTAVEVLAEVSAAMDQGDGDHGRGGVGCGAQGVAGQHAQAARVGRKLPAKAQSPWRNRRSGAVRDRGRQRVQEREAGGHIGKSSFISAENQKLVRRGTD